MYKLIAEKKSRNIFHNKNIFFTHKIISTIIRCTYYVYCYYYCLLHYLAGDTLNRRFTYAAPRANDRRLLLNCDVRRAENRPSKLDTLVILYLHPKNTNKSVI